MRNRQQAEHHHQQWEEVSPDSALFSVLINDFSDYTSLSDDSDDVMLVRPGVWRVWWDSQGRGWCWSWNPSSPHHSHSPATSNNTGMSRDLENITSFYQTIYSLGNIAIFYNYLEPYKIDILIYPLALLKISCKARLDWSLKFKGLIKFKVSGFEADHQFILKIKKRENHCISAAPRKLLKSILTFR